MYKLDFFEEVESDLLALPQDVFEEANNYFKKYMEDEKELDKGLRCFNALLDYWVAKNNFEYQKVIEALFMAGVQEFPKIESLQNVGRTISEHRKNYMKEYLREWHKRNPDKHKLYAERRKFKIDPIAEAERKRAWAKAHPEYCLEYAKKYRQLNKEKIKILGQKW